MQKEHIVNSFIYYRPLWAPNIIIWPPLPPLLWLPQWKLPILKTEGSIKFGKETMYTSFSFYCYFFHLYFYWPFLAFMLFFDQYQYLVWIGSFPMPEKIEGKNEKTISVFEVIGWHRHILRYLMVYGVQKWNLWRFWYLICTLSEYSVRLLDVLSLYYCC